MNREEITTEQMKEQIKYLQEKIKNIEEDEVKRLFPILEEMGHIALGEKWDWAKWSSDWKDIWMNIARYIDKNYIPIKEVVDKPVIKIPEDERIKSSDFLKHLPKFHQDKFFVDPDPEFDSIASEHFWELVGNSSEKGNLMETNIVITDDKLGKILFEIFYEHLVVDVGDVPDIDKPSWEDVDDEYKAFWKNLGNIAHKRLQENE